MSVRTVSLALSVTIALVVPLAAVHTDGGQTMPTTELQPASTPVVQDLFAGCVSNGSSSNSESSHSDNVKTTWRARWKRGDCSFDMASEGSIIFKNDVTSVQRIAPGGYMDVTTNIHGDVTRLVARPSSTGTVEFTWTRNDKPAEFSSEGAAWFARFLISLDRHTAFAIDSRFPRLLQEGGARRVLDEVDRMNGDHAKAAYLLRLIPVGRLRADDLRRAYEAAATMTSDYEIGRVLVTAAETYDLADVAVRAAFLNATLNLNSDYEHARTLMAFLARTTPTRDQVAAILRLRTQSRPGRGGPAFPMKATTAQASARSHSQTNRARALAP